MWTLKRPCEKSRDQRRSVNCVVPEILESALKIRKFPKILEIFHFKFDKNKLALKICPKNTCCGVDIAIKWLILPYNFPIQLLKAKLSAF